MLSEQTKLELLKLSVQQSQRNAVADFDGAVAKIYTQFYNLINSDPSPAAGQRRKRGSDKPDENDILS